LATSKILYMKDSGTGSHAKHLKAAIHYITDPVKTQEQRLVGSLNCLSEYAFEQMRDTKKKYGKIDKRQGYHLIISFKEGEVKPDTAFEITEKFARAYLGEQYEAVYSVHDNTAHIHSHIVFNSVSFLDGKKYRYKKGDWAKEIQPITNRLCEEYEISIIDIEEDRAKDHGDDKEWDEYKHGPFVWSDMIKRDLDMCILQAKDYEDFLDRLREKGYEIKEGKYLSVKPPKIKKFRRTKALGEMYTKERIQERIQREQLSDYKMESFEEMEQIVYKSIPRGKRAKPTGLQKQYYEKLYNMGFVQKRPYSQSWKYKEEIRQMHKLQEQYKYLVEHDIETMEQLVQQKDELQEQKKAISGEKKKTYQARKQYEDLFIIQEQMEAIHEGENAYKSGDNFFEEEHQKWIMLEKSLLEKGCSYLELEKMKNHYQSEIRKLKSLDRAVTKEIRIVRTILDEMNLGGREREKAWKK